ncbi:MAG: hypothetical protein B6244_03525 [Candidatus Cloacimonetes bacterium 4572_55]|nr:MAG: hypothetical protein B6244_03525 [Candidatus Cloacimonetes bacterium 4572_55]
MERNENAKYSNQIIQLLREESVNSDFIRSKIASHARNHVEFYAEVLKLLTHLEFDADEAKEHWQKIVAHQDEMSVKLDREVDLRVGILDYFTHINKQIENPKIIEISIFEQTMESAMTDGLTGIYNRRYFEENLFREFQRAKRYNLVMSVLMIDIDHFKEYNDTYGHPQGDLALIEVANIIMKCCRDSDIPCRYGGEEFCVIMPETIGPDGLHLTKRIANMVQSYSSVKHDNSVWCQPVTLSSGIASYPIDAKYPKELVQKADIALYQAKRDGRNRSYLYYEERRRYVRFDISFVVNLEHLTGQENKKIPAKVKNIAVGGVLLESNKAFAIGSILSLEMRLPGMDHNVKMLTKVVRIEERVDDRYDMGLAFVEVHEKDIEPLNVYMRHATSTDKFAKSIRR